jgi:HCOMODA/2-hydroxy-3-carboxy-muconic semialdehyde decarboxylase
MTNRALSDIDPAVIDDLVDSNHILYRQGVVDGFGHISVRALQSEHFLIARSMAPASPPPTS